MIRLPTRLSGALDRLRGSRARFVRSEDAGRRLDAARLRYETSVVSLRKAALDHVDCQDIAGIALRANLARLARRSDAAIPAAGS